MIKNREKQIPGLKLNEYFCRISNLSIMKTYLVILGLFLGFVGRSQSNHWTDGQIRVVFDSALDTMRSGRLESAMKKVNNGFAMLYSNMVIDPKLRIYGMYVKGRIYETQKKYIEEFPLFDSLLLFAQHENLDTGFIYARSLLHYASSCLYTDRTELAFKPLIKARKIFELIKDKDNSLYASSILIFYYQQKEMSFEAENLILESESQIDSSYNKGFIAYFYNKVVRFYTENNIADKAAFYIKKINELSGSNTYLYCKNLCENIMNYSNSEDTTEVIRMVNELLQCETLLIESDKSTSIKFLLISAESIIKKGIMSLMMADSLLNEAQKLIMSDNPNLDIIMKSDNLDNYISLLYLKGMIALKKSDLNLMKEVIDIYSEITGGFEKMDNLGPDKDKLILMVASIYYSKMNDPRLYLLLDKYQKKIQKELNNALSFMTDGEISQFLENDIISKFDIFFSLYNPDILPNEYSNFLYNLSLNIKGMQLRNSQNIHKFLFKSSDSLVINLRNRLIDTELKLSEFDISKNLILQRKKEILQREALRLYSKQHLEEKIDVKKVKSALFGNEIAVEFIRYKSGLDAMQSVHYLALILDSKKEYPMVINLCNEDQLNPKLNSKLVAVNDPFESNSELRGTGLIPKKSNISGQYKLIWEPILSMFPNTEKIYFTTSGILNQINLTAIPIDDSISMFERYEMHQLSTTNYIPSIKLKLDTTINSALLIGGVDYGSNSSTKNGSKSTHWDFLNGSLLEVNQAQDLLKASRISTTLLTGKEAEESTVNKELLQPYGLIHLATHGAQTSYNYSENKFDYLREDPLKQSVLVLAKVNELNKEGNPESNNGYLNALEISQMDLTGTNLVVLSSCESGLGVNVSQYELNFGLIRGFKIAGAKSIITSLWSVADIPTQEFMTTFYNQILNHHKSIHSAFYITQGEMKKKYRNPLYWSGFTLLD